MARTLGLCSFCDAPARLTCILCGRPMCEAHHAPRTGRCTACTRGEVFDEGLWAR